MVEKDPLLEILSNRNHNEYSDDPLYPCKTCIVVAMCSESCQAFFDYYMQQKYGDDDGI